MGLNQAFQLLLQEHRDILHAFLIDLLKDYRMKSLHFNENAPFDLLQNKLKSLKSSFSDTK